MMNRRREIAKQNFFLKFVWKLVLTITLEFAKNGAASK